jgi:hypothetical protein
METARSIPAATQSAERRRPGRVREAAKSKADSPKSWTVDAKTIDQETFDLSVKSPNGNEEIERLAPFLHLKYQDSIADAVADLGRPDEIGKVFSGFQKYLYEQAAA